MSSTEHPESRHRLGGIIAAVHTPMRGDFSLHLDAIDLLAERSIADRLSGAFICGTTGEFASLSLEERLAVAERWASVDRQGLKLIVQVGGTCLDEAKKLAAHAAAIGADAISAIPPYFFKPDLESLVHFCQEIAAAAPGLPFYYYHLPSLSGVDLPMLDFLDRARHRIPSLAGVKFSHHDLVDLGRCARIDGGRFDMLFGIDEALVSGLAVGAVGAVGTTYGLTARLGRGILEAYASGDVDRARELQGQSMDLVAIFKNYGGHRAMKGAMKLTGIDCGPVRPPQRGLAADELDSLRAELEAAGFRKFCSGSPTRPTA